MNTSTAFICTIFLLAGMAISSVTIANALERAAIAAAKGA
jgi:hypothetical protein